MNKEELFEFLEEEGALKPFLVNAYNVIDSLGIEEDFYYEQLFSLSDEFKDSPIAFAFTWGATPEGRLYWRKITDKHLQTLTK